MAALFHIWVYLATTPLLGLAATLLVFQVALRIHVLCKRHTFSNPMLISIVMLAIGLRVTKTSYAAYFQGAQYIHFLLGPATVALAIPLYANVDRITRSARAIVPALLAGSVTAAVVAIVVARALGAPSLVVRSLAPKSVTTPVAMGIADQIGGQPSLAAALVLLTGLSAIVLVGPIMRWCRVRDPRAVGLAGGTAGHGIVTAHLLQSNETAGAFAGLAIGLNALATSILVPILIRLLLRG